MGRKKIFVFVFSDREPRKPLWPNQLFIRSPGFFNFISLTIDVSLVRLLNKTVLQSTARTNVPTLSMQTEEGKKSSRDFVIINIAKIAEFV